MDNRDGTFFFDNLTGPWLNFNVVKKTSSQASEVKHGVFSYFVFKGLEGADAKVRLVQDMPT